MRVKRIFFIILLVSLFVACKKPPTFSCRLYSDGNVLLEKEYALSSSPLFFHRKNLSEEYEKSGSCAIDFLRGKSETLARDIERCCEKISFPKEEPDFTYEGDGKFTFKKGKAGRAAYAEEVAALLIKNEGVYFGEIPTHVLLPAYDENDLAFHCRKISTFSSDYSSSSPERKHNIALAVKKLDNLTVEAGEELSFNQAVGKRTKESGYKEAGVILYGEYSRGVGGGVCQVSTTLYNAWCLAGLASTSQNHSLTVSYVPAGMDAMVSDSSDLVLKNDGEFPVFLDAECDGKRVTFTLYGTPPAATVRLWSEKVLTLPCDEYDVVEGTEEKILSSPKDGYVYKTYRDFYKNDILVQRENLRVSHYRKVKGKKIVPSAPQAWRLFGDLCLQNEALVL